MISYHDWQIESSGLLARQFDHLSRRLEVVGDLPEEWDWAMLVQSGDAMDIIPLEPMDGGVGHTLSEDQLSLSGHYAMQLRGSKGNVIRHTNILYVFVAESLSGSGQWPSVPSEFLEVERHIAELNAHPPVPGVDGFWLIWNSDTDMYEKSAFPLPEAGSNSNITAENIKAALGYTPADAKIVSQLSDENVVGTTIGGKCAEFAFLMNNTDRVERFIFVTDPHLAEGDDYEKQMRSYLKTLKTYYDASPASFVICGGDWIGNSDTQKEACFKLGFIDGLMRNDFHPYYPALGNHDTNYQGVANEEAEKYSGTLTNETIRNLMMSGQANTYYSFDGVNTRFYMLDTGSDWVTDMTDYRWKQIAWLADQLTKDDAANSAIVLHIVYGINGNGGLDLQPFAGSVIDLCHAYNNAESVTMNGVTYDFSVCSGRVRFMLSGHIHQDHISTVKDIPIVTTTHMREDGIPTFDLCLADYDNDIMHLVRVGSGENRSVGLTKKDSFAFLPMVNFEGSRLSAQRPTRMVLAASVANELPYAWNPDAALDKTYYAIPIPPDATKVKITCPGLRFGLSHCADDGRGIETRQLDTGWLESGSEVTFDHTYSFWEATFGHPNDSASFTAYYDTSGIIIEYS